MRVGTAGLSAHSRTAGTRKPSAFRLGALARAFSRGREGPTHVVAEDVADLDAVGQRLDARGVELLELRHEVDDRVELAGEQAPARRG